MLCGDGVAAPAASASTFPFPGASLPVWVIYPTATTEQRSRASLRQDSRAGTDFDSISASARNLHRDSESRDSERCSPTQAHDKKDLCGCEKISPKVWAYQILIRHPFDVAFFACLMSGFILRQGFIFFSLFRRFPFFNTTRSYFGFPANHQAGSFCSPSFLRRSLSFSLALSLSLSWAFAICTIWVISTTCLNARPTGNSRAESKSEWWKSWPDEPNMLHSHVQMNIRSRDAFVLAY